MKLKLINIPVDEESDFLSSHILGCPDVPSEWNDNAVFYNDEIFIGQINLSEYPLGDLNEGLLYFFIASKSHPYRGIVRYTEDLNNIERIEFNSEVNFKYDLNKEYLLAKEDGELDYYPSNIKLNNYSLKNDEVILLNIKLDIFSDTGGEITYLIKKNDLKNKDFSKAYLSIKIDE